MLVHVNYDDRLNRLEVNVSKLASTFETKQAPSCVQEIDKCILVFVNTPNDWGYEWKT